MHRPIWGPIWTGSRPPLRPGAPICRDWASGAWWPRSSPIGCSVGRYADQIGRIDTAAFRAGVKLRVPVWVGNLLLLLGVAVGGLAVWAAYAWTTPLWKGLALIAAGAIWAVAVHSRPTGWWATWSGSGGPTTSWADRRRPGPV